MSVERRQAVIVGAGPVGLLTALGLARQGVEVTVLDSEPEVVRSPRAAVYFHTTISILRKLGLADEAHAIGLSSTEFRMHWLETGEVMSSDMRDALEPGQEFDHNLHFGQHILAELVMRHLARLPNTEVLWNHTVKALAQTGTEARVAVDTDEGEVVFEADWIIGTDGARSTVRKLAGLPFEGMTWPDRFVATNIEYPFRDFGYANANVDVNGLVTNAAATSYVLRKTGGLNLDAWSGGLLDASRPGRLVPRRGGAGDAL